MNKDSKEAIKREGKIIQINEQEIQTHVDDIVRDTVEETLNALLDAEADKLCRAKRYERNPDRQDTRAGHYKRKLHVKAGEVELKVPKLRKLTFESAIIERYRRRESSVEEALMEMPIGIMLFNDQYYIECANPFLSSCFNERTLVGRSLYDTCESVVPLIKQEVE